MSDPGPPTQSQATLTPPDYPPVAIDSAEPPDSSRWSQYAELAIALAVVALGIVVLVQTQDIRVTRAIARVGPRIIPTIVGWGLIAVGCWYIIDIVRGDHGTPSADSEDVDITLPADWLTIGGIGVALVGYMVMIKPAGFILASTVLFTVTAFSMGSRKIVRDIVIGILLTTAAYYAFSHGLGVRLPQGVLDGLI